MIDDCEQNEICLDLVGYVLAPGLIVCILLALASAIGLVEL